MIATLLVVALLVSLLCLIVWGIVSTLRATDTVFPTAQAGWKQRPDGTGHPADWPYDALSPHDSEGG